MSMPSLCTEGPHPFIDLDMGKYIDANRLCAEIEKTYKSEIQPWLSGVSATSAIYDYVLPLIDSLQREQQEGDLEKEIEEYFEGWSDDSEYGQAIMRNCVCAGVDECKDIARYFYNLGLNARKKG